MLVDDAHHLLEHLSPESATLFLREVQASTEQNMAESSGYCSNEAGASVSIAVGTDAPTVAVVETSDFEKEVPVPQVQLQETTVIGEELKVQKFDKGVPLPQAQLQETDEQVQEVQRQQTEAIVATVQEASYGVIASDEPHVAEEGPFADLAEPLLITSWADCECEQQVQENHPWQKLPYTGKQQRKKSEDGRDNEVEAVIGGVGAQVDGENQDEVIRRILSLQPHLGTCSAPHRCKVRPTIAGRN